MALNDFAVHFDNAYEDVVQKVLVGKAIANLRFEATLTYGESVERVAYDISKIRVRNVTRGSASTVDTLTDSSSTLTINLEKETCFHLSDGEMKQAGPLNPGTIIGGKLGLKTAADLDARILYETTNAYYNFDMGDLTGTDVNGSPINLHSDSVPQMVTRMPAKLQRNNQVLSNLALVVDSYIAADLAQYLLGKQFDVVNAIFKNGYVDGQVAGAELYVSENLTGEAVFSCSSWLNANTISIGGVIFTAESQSPGTEATYGGFYTGASGTDGLEYLKNLINNPSSSVAGYYSALSEDDIITVVDSLRLSVADSSGSTGSLSVVGTGSGRLSVAETADGRWAQNYIHCYYGKKGSIDVVVQSFKPVDIRQTADRRGNNLFSSYIGGIKTFPDGSKQFLDVWIAAQEL